jgi:CxxC-x17-CxxC domain-containing protein
MKDFRRPSGQGAGRSGGFGGKPAGGGFEKRGFGNHKGDFNAGERREIKHKTVCSDCGNTCEVPFRPNGSKPVYCKDCFGGKKGAPYAPQQQAKPAFVHAAPASAPVARDARIDELKAQVDSMQSKLDRILSALEQKKEAAPKKEGAVAKKPVAKKVVAKKAAPKKKK